MNSSKRRRLFKKRRAASETQINILPKHVLFVLSFLSITVMFLSYKFPERLEPVKNIVDTVVAPMQVGINHVGNNISDSLQKFEDIEALRAENELLKQQLSEARNQAQMTNQDKYELNTLRDLYELDKRYSDYPKVAARIIARDGNGWYNVFTVDKGSNDGIETGMNVIAGNGLVGIVTDVRKNTSVIRAVIDDNSSVSAMFSVSTDTAIVSGSMSLMKQKGRIKMSMISMNADIIDNEEVITSNISDKYLPGILIGYVKDVYVDSSNLTKAAYLVPAVDFEHLNEVLIITVLKEDYDMD